MLLNILWLIQMNYENWGRLPLGFSGDEALGVRQLGFALRAKTASGRAALSQAAALQGACGADQKLCICPRFTE
jgi:hypothetical protein